MIQLTEKTRERLMLLHGCSMLLLGLALFYIRATMTNLLFYVFGGAFALLLVAASLLFVAGLDWICAAGFGRRRRFSQLRGLLLVSTGVALCSVFLIFYPGATFQMLCFVLAAYALTMSVGKFALARAWTGSKRVQRIVYALAAAALTFAVCLVVFSSAEDRASLFVVASYSLFMGLQMLLTMYLLERQMLKSTEQKLRLKHASVIGGV